MQKQPYIKFYTRDWMNDIKLKSLTAADKGIWIDILCLMSETEKFGYLSDGGKPMDDEKIADLLMSRHIPRKVCLMSIRHLVNSQVMSKDSDGYYYSKRMVNDYNEYSESKKNGIFGATTRIRNLKKQQLINNTPSSPPLRGVFNQSESESESESSPPSPPSQGGTHDVQKPPVTGRTVKLVDEAFISELNRLNSYPGVDLEAELGKLKAWCLANGKTSSQKRFVNWLNKTVATMATSEAKRQVAKNRQNSANLQVSATTYPTQHFKPAIDPILADCEVNHAMLLALKTNPWCADVNITHEFNVMNEWCERHKRYPTKQFFLDWIERALIRKSNPIRPVENKIGKEESKDILDRVGLKLA